MRIEAYNQIAQLYSATKAQAPAKSNKISMGTDKLELSSVGRDLQIAKQAVAETSDIREDKVAELKSKIDSGTYHVDTADFASMLLAKYNERL